jgi:hypothetical protein
MPQRAGTALACAYTPSHELDAAGNVIEFASHDLWSLERNQRAMRKTLSANASTLLPTCSKFG